MLILSVLHLQPTSVSVNATHMLACGQCSCILCIASWLLLLLYLHRSVGTPFTRFPINATDYSSTVLEMAVSSWLPAKANPSSASVGCFVFTINSSTSFQLLLVGIQSLLM